MASFKVSFTLEESDAAYFRNLYKAAKKKASRQDPQQIIREALALVKVVQESNKVPKFVADAVSTLEDMTQIIRDDDYQAPAAVKNQVLAALAYFSNPEDLIPDHIPALGFLDDAIMVKFVEEEFKHELWGYRKFRSFTRGAEQRPWTDIARERLPRRIEEQRKKIRAEINKKRAADAAKKKDGSKRRLLGW